MFEIYRVADKFLCFLRDELVPFLTEPISSLHIPVFSPLTLQMRFVEVPWLFGTFTWAEFLLYGGLTLIIGWRFLKFFTDGIGL